jgi:hypothetical protein
MVAPAQESLEQLVMLGVRAHEAAALAQAYPDPRVLEAVVYHVRHQRPRKAAAYASVVAATVAAQLAELEDLHPPERRRGSQTPREPRLVELELAFAAVYLPCPALTGAEGAHALALLEVITAEGLVHCWTDIRDGNYGDDWLRDQLSFSALDTHQRMLNWLDWYECGRRTDPGYRREPRP